MPDVTDDPAQLHPDTLITDFDTFENHGHLDDNQEAVDMIYGFADKGFLHRCKTLDECISYLGGQQPVLSKFACLSKTKFDANSGKMRHKLKVIMDSKRSGVKAASARKFKAVLPRITDAIHAALDLLDSRESGELLEFLVVDAEDAFWQLPLRVSERRFFVGKVRNEYFIYTRTAQGSRGAPVSWAALFGLSTRCIQGLYR